MGHTYHDLLVVSTKFSVFLALLMFFLLPGFLSWEPFFTWLTLTHPFVPGQALSPSQASPGPQFGLRAHPCSQSTLVHLFLSPSLEIISCNIGSFTDIGFWMLLTL